MDSLIRSVPEGATAASMLAAHWESAVFTADDGGFCVIDYPYARQPYVLFAEDRFFSPYFEQTIRMRLQGAGSDEGLTAKYRTALDALLVCKKNIYGADAAPVQALSPHMLTF